MKRTVGIVEAVFDSLYLLSARTLGVLLLRGEGARQLAGVMALVLAFGDAFHLLPRIQAIRTGRWAELRGALGRGKEITSVTMTVFYLLLWQVGLLALRPADVGGYTAALYALAAVRIVLCLLPRNGWQTEKPSVGWGVARNVPFLLQGGMVALLFERNWQSVPGLRWMWLAIALSFGCYLPVVLWAHRRPALGSLMLPKTCAYLWMLAMCLSL